jgi:AraC-like DNA-binding protein
VEQHYRGRKQVRDYAELLGVTPNHLVETVRRTLGKTPGQLLSARLLLEAKRLLVYTPQTVAEIGYALNFTSPAQFGRWFQNLEGCPPGHFRQTFVAQQV